MITKYGYNTLSIIVLICFLIAAIAIFTKSPYLKYSLFSISVLFLIFSINFFRDPDRNTPSVKNAVISPADGRVLIIKNVFESEFINEECIQVSIFMSPLNVHVNRIPIDGIVKYLKYFKGEYLVAYHDKADKRNERSVIGIESKFGKILFTQVAGMVARRIVNDLKENEEVKSGERFGMIKFGSRVDILVPKDWSIKVKEGDVVFAGESIIFENNK